MSYKILTGSSEVVEEELNNLEKGWHIKVVGVAATNIQIKVVVHITGSK
jgi:hypothetical protein